MDPTSQKVLSPRRPGPAGTAGGAGAVKALDQVAPERLDAFCRANDASSRALALAQAGRREEAGREMAAALAGSPDSAWAHLRRARLHLLCGDLVAMSTALRRAMETTEPPLTAQQRAMAEALLQLG